MKKNLISLAVAASLGLMAASAAAEDMYRGAWYAVPGVSYMNTDSDLEADNGAGGFIAIGKELSEKWDIQARLGHTRVDEDLDIAGAGGKYKQTALGLDALYMFSRDKFRPFLLAGLGVARNNVDYDISGTDIGDKKTSWMANVGLGLQYLFSDSFGLQADLRHQWSRAKSKDAPAFGYEGETETVGNTLLNLGGIFRFGAPAPAPVVEEPAPAPEPVAIAPEPAPAPAPEPAPAPAPEPVKCTPQVDTITVGAEKLFGFDKANLKDEGKAALDEAAAKIKANPEIRAVFVTGHTDRFGSEAYNQKLSERRAKQVAEYLVSQGVDSSIITAEGKGESMPVVECAGKKATKKVVSCLQPNRRVEIRAEGQKESGCN